MQNNTPAPRERTIEMLTYLGAGLALSALLAGMVAGVGHRWQWWGFGFGFAILKWAVYGAAGALAISILAAFLTRPATARRGFGRAVLAGLLSAAIISVPAYWLSRAKQVPRIHDITTDTADPPQFVAVRALRQGAPNTLDYGGLETAIQQQQAYPDITTLLLTLNPTDTYQQALSAATALGWEIVAAVPEDRRIEATDTTFWFGFKDDIVIRIRAMDAGSRLDIRSVSREGVSDVGTNAKRIRKFLRLMRERAAQ